MLGKILEALKLSQILRSTVPSGVHPVVISGNSRRRPEEISEFIDLYPDKGNQYGGEIKPYKKGFDEHVVEDIEIKKKVTWTKSYSSPIFGF
jgi:hypothetical protein